jgi:hypothetical protein
MDGAVACKRACYTDDFRVEENKKTICGGGCGRGEQIQHYLLGFLGSLLFAVTVYGADEPGSFNHKKHGPLKLQCVSCHPGAVSADLAGFPAMKQCKVCHVGMAERNIPSRRVYEVPDFVFFSHGKHAKAECKSCHGDVLLQEVVQAQQMVKMKWCVDCHKDNKAAVACNTCHELGQ